MMFDELDLLSLPDLIVMLPAFADTYTATQILGRYKITRAGKSFMVTSDTPPLVIHVEGGMVVERETPSDADIGHLFGLLMSNVGHKVDHDETDYLVKLLDPIIGQPSRHPIDRVVDGHLVTVRYGSGRDTSITISGSVVFLQYVRAEDDVSIRVITDKDYFPEALEEQVEATVAGAIGL